ncbi:MAG: ABC transporter permease subunit [Firmicutes bacterium]|nr:ABC transporter permease subunit [Bacillota bacterium]
MKEGAASHQSVPQRPRDRKYSWDAIKKQKELILMSIPFCIYIFIFSYLPIWGWSMAFQNYRLGKSFFEQEWAGLKHFKLLFLDEGFGRVIRNTVAMSFINLVLGFATAIILALLLNELKNRLFKRTVQTISYLPHFLSWVIAAGIVSSVLSSDGIVNDLLMKLNIIDKPVLWLSVGKYFWGVVGVSTVWKELGWNTIIYLGAMSAIDPTLYEAAAVDGVGRLRKMWHITLPGIKPTVIILLIMSIGRLLEAGFEVQYLLGRGMTMDWAETIDIFALNYGIKIGNYSLGTAAGIFKSIVSIILIFLANGLAKKIGEERLI